MHAFGLKALQWADCRAGVRCGCLQGVQKGTEEPQPELDTAPCRATVRQCRHATAAATKAATSVGGAYTSTLLMTPEMASVACASRLKKTTGTHAGQLSAHHCCGHRNSSMGSKQPPASHATCVLLTKSAGRMRPSTASQQWVSLPLLLAPSRTGPR
jgi:hypothetical protein